MPEEVRSVPGYDGIFATDQGRILRKHKQTGEFNEVAMYAQVSITEWDSIKRQKKKINQTVHRLVSLAFHGEPPPGKNLVRHLDGNSMNNAPSNLAWGNYEENYQDAVKHGKSAPRNPKLKRRPPQVETVQMYKRRTPNRILKNQLTKAKKRERERARLLRVPRAQLLSDDMKDIVRQLYELGFGYKRITKRTKYPLNAVRYQCDLLIYS